MKKLAPEAAVRLVEQFWEMPAGWLYSLRQGDYDPSGAEALLETLRAIDVSDETVLPRRLVSLTWMIPEFMRWQIDRVRQQGGDVDSLRRDIVLVHNAIEQLLGVA